MGTRGPLADRRSVRPKSSSGQARGEAPRWGAPRGERGGARASSTAPPEAPYPVNRRAAAATMEGVDAPLPPFDNETWATRLAAARRLARHLVRDDGDDVAQEAAQIAWTRPASPGRPAWPWLAGIIRNVARARRRREARRPAVEAHAVRPPTTDDDVAETVARAEQHRQAIDAVLALSEPYRSTLILRFLDDLTPDEVARRQGVPLETVRTRVRRGLELVRTQLDARHGGNRRNWMLLLAPMPPIGAPAAPVARVAATLPSAAPAVLGALAMKQFVAVAISLLLIVGGAWWAVHALRAPSPDRATRSAPAVGDGEYLGDGPELAAVTLRPAALDAAAADELAPRAAAPDRDLDVAGVVVRADGTPVAGAAIAAEDDEERTLFLLGRHVASAAARVVASTRSAADGGFALPLPRGAVTRLRVAAAGLETATLRSVGAGDRLRVVLSEPVTLVVVANDVRGRPLSGADVVVARPAGRMTWGYVRETYRRVQRTAEDGRAVFADVPAGNGGTWTLVTVSTPTRGTVAHASVEMPERGTVTKVMVAEAEATFRGRVTDAATGAPIAGAVVGAEWHQRPSATTDPDGRYVLTAGNAATIDALFAEAPGYAWMGRPRDGDQPVDFALRAAVTLRGRLLDPAGAPVANAVVSAHGSYRGALPAGRGLATSGPDGRFAVAGLSSGTRTAVWIEATGFGRLGAVLAASDAAPHRDLGDLVLHPARRVEGRVVDTLGAPVAGVPVALALHAALTTDALDLGATEAGHAAVHDERVTDDLGRFRFAGVAAGRARVRVWPPGRPEQRRDVEVAADDILDVRFVVEAGRPFHVHVRLPDGTTPETVAVRVVDAGGSPLRASTFRERPATFVVADGPVQVDVESSPLDTDRPPPQTAAPDVSEITIVLRAANPVTGTVLDPDERPMRGAMVEGRVEGVLVGRAVTDAEGRFSLKVPDDGAAVAPTGKVLAPSTNQATQLPLVTDPIHAVPGTTDVVFRMRRVPAGQTLRVVVADPDGRPLAGIPLAASRDDGVPLGTGTSDADGIVEFRDLVGIALRVTRGSGVYEFRRTWLDPVLDDVIPGGQTVSYRLRAGTVLTIRVTEPDGSPSRGARVRWRTGVGAPTRWGLASTSSDGYAVTVDPTTDFPLTLDVEVPGESPPRTAKLTLEALPTGPVTVLLPARPGPR